MTVAARKKKDEIVIPFLDKHAFNKADGYACPNEDVLAWRKLIQDLTFDRAAGICSGGEVGFFAILPSVQTELVLIDHSYHSLAYALYKYTALKKLGWKKAKELFENGDKYKLIKEFEKVRPIVPKVVADKFSPFDLYAPSVNRYWKQQEDDAVKLLVKNLDKVQFVHGDLTDLEGPVDLLYLSNALEHTDRNRTAPVLAEVAKVVRPGGYVIDCSYERTPKDWKRLNCVRTSWNQCLYQLPA